MREKNKENATSETNVLQEGAAVLGNAGRDLFGGGRFRGVSWCGEGEKA